MSSRPKFASFFIRFLATLIDGLILIIPCLVASYLLPFVGGFLVLIFYEPILESSEVRATIGKHLMGIQVTDLEGRRITFKVAILRFLLKCASSFVFFLGHFVALFTQRKQALHDLVADTVVVYGRIEQIPLADAWVKEVKDLYDRLFKTNNQDKVLSELERLHSLREKGVLTEEEFQREKAKVLGRTL